MQRLNSFGNKIFGERPGSVVGQTVVIVAKKKYVHEISLTLMMANLTYKDTFEMELDDNLMI